VRGRHEVGQGRGTAASRLHPDMSVEGMLKGAAPLTARARHSRDGSSTLAAEEEDESSPAPCSN